jgi:hypothetical protein
MTPSIFELAYGVNVDVCTKDILCFFSILILFCAIYSSYQIRVKKLTFILSLLLRVSVKSKTQLDP